MPGPALEMEPVEPQSLKKLSFKSLKRALDLFSPVHGHVAPPDSESKKIRISHKISVEYGGIDNTSTKPTGQASSAAPDALGTSAPSNALALPGPDDSRDAKATTHNALVIGPTVQPNAQNDGAPQGRSSAIVSASGSSERMSTSAIMERIPSKWPRPVWHAPWRNYRVISGHLGWVRSVAFDPSNTWFCTGSADRTIKIWDVASGKLKLTLTGHIEQIRGLAVSNKHTYMFSAGDDKQVKCWDLEQNKVIRSYHGHLSGVYCLALHPTIDVLLTGGRDSVCRVWDIRSKMQIHALSGHDNTVCSVFTRPTDPQVVTGSHDTTIKFWDLRYGKTMTTLTYHKKSVRAMALHPKEHSFASASADNIKKFNLPRGEFVHNMLSQQKTIINAMAVNEEGVMVTGGDNGSLWFWDWKSGHNFQQSQTIVQPGSLDSEAGIYALSYDITGSRLITCEADKTIKMWKEDENATPETHPLNFKPPKDIRRF
ncbi:protein pleiotropic regulatory locus 1 [Momordica charantia]|uniref:Protein pleiotropic regulatory locus 1 n=1 Tax=Momordica charantia TaxID=3673 RepID=A0A6J1CB66_MOMCH|nr:protein pleiotropic regulatory locus 1 [Momordica charantia]XP_022138466.1 protein pleiotropic regulatory locus 1 [Momordica charantia]XP_022138467.1 protein pleiotropic regulatory locus 1 [Momordica charantia]XP_022138468.1 protein pleiotropic regulatory locus 1 [Momordica charantia]